MVAVGMLVGESGALVWGVRPMDGLVVSVAECGCWEGTLADGAKCAVTGGGSMVGSAVCTGEFSGVGALFRWGLLTYSADVGGRWSVAMLWVLVLVLVRVTAVVVGRVWVVLWVEVVVVELVSILSKSQEERLHHHQ